MGQIRLANAALTLRLPPAARPAAAGLKREARERFVPSVLEHLAGELEAACAPGAVIRIRRLRLRVAATLAGFRDGSLAREIAQDLAGQALDAAPGNPVAAVAQGAEAEVLVFPTRTAWWLARVLAAVRGGAGPEGVVEETADLARAVSGLSAAERGGIWRKLEAEAPEVLKALPKELAAALDVDPSMLDHPVEGGADVETGPVDERRPLLPRTSNRRAGEAEDPQSWDDVTEATAGDPVGGDAPEVDVSDGVPKGVQGPHAQPSPSSPSPERAVDDEAVDPVPVQRRRVEAGTGPQTCPTPDDSSGAAPGDRAAAAEDGSEAVPDRRPDPKTTTWAGVAYLLNITLRLDLPERLWRIGVDEGDTLADMIARLTGDPSDPLPHSLRVDPDLPLPQATALPDWAREELVADTLSAACDRALSPGLRERVAGLDAVFQDSEIWQPAGWLAALHAAIFEDLLGAAEGLGELRGRWRRTGQLTRTGDEVRLTLPLSAIDMDIRRLGLDSSPGYLPWLDRRLVIDFFADEDDLASGAVL